MPRLRLLIAGVLLSTIVAFGSSVPVDASRQEEQAPGAEGSALAELGACVADRDALSVLFLIDESSSLQNTDPDALRVTAMLTALEALRFISRLEVEGETPSIEVRFASFALDFQTQGNEWVSLTSDNVESLTDAAELFASRDVGFDTDYVEALSGAQETFSERMSDLTAEPGSERPCQLLLWFTDGRFNLIPRDTDNLREQYGETKPWAPDIPILDQAGADRALERGRELLCGGPGVDQPIVDRLRNDDVFNVAVALSTDLGRDDTSFLEGLATGRSNRVECGAVGDRAVGDLIAAGDLQDLIGAFYGPILEGPGDEYDPDGSQGEACQDVPAPECTREFELDEGLRQFNLLGLTDAGELRVILTGASGADVELSSGEDGNTTVDDVALEWTWINESVVAVTGRMDVNSDAWVGTWRAAFLDPTGEATVSNAQVFLFGNLRPEVPDGTVITLGEVNRIPIDIVAEEGTPSIPDGLIDATTVRAELDTAEESTALSTQRDGDAFVATFDAPDDLSTRIVDVSVELGLTTTRGFELDPVVRNFRLPVELPEIYPTIVNEDLNLASTQGTDAAHATVEIVGSPVSSGTVCIGEVQVEALPDGVEGIEASTSSGGDDPRCVDVPEDETVEMDLDLRPDHEGTGRVHGAVRFELASEQDDEVRAVDLPLDFQMSEPPIDCFWCVLVGLLVPAVLLPLLFFWFMKWLVAKFAPPGRFRAGGIDVIVGPGDRVVRSGGSDSLSLRGRDIPNVLPAGNRTEKKRRFTWQEASLDLHSLTGWNLFAPPGGMAAPTTKPSARRFVSGGVHSPVATIHDGGTTADFPLSLGGTWVFEAAEGDLRAARAPAADVVDGQVVGRVWLVMDDTVDPDREAASLAEAINDQLPAGVENLIDQASLAESTTPEKERRRRRSNKESEAESESAGQSSEEHDDDPLGIWDDDIPTSAPSPPTGPPDGPISGDASSDDDVPDF